MDSSVVSLPLPVAHLVGPSASPSLAASVDDQVEAASTSSRKKKKRKIKTVTVTSFVALFGKYGCLTKCEGQYMISLGASESWQTLFEYTQSVDSFKFNRDAVLEAAQISPSVFVYISQQLKGKLLFPNLTTIQLDGLDTSSHYLPLLSSTCLEHITLKLVSESSFLEFTVYVFLENLASTSPGLQSLKLQNVTGMAPQMLNAIVNFQHLHTLEIIRFADAQNFEKLRALGSLAHLEYLSLTVGRSERLTYTRSTQSVSSDSFLPSLRELRIEALSDVVSDLILFITSDRLEVFTFRHISTRTANPSQSTLSTQPILKSSNLFASSFSANLKVDNIVKEKVNFLGDLSSRWPQQMKEVTIIPSADLEIDLRDVARLQALGSLKFNGTSIVNARETFDGPYGFRNSLQSLHLSGLHASLSLLRTIALSTPFLREMTISIHIGERPPPSTISAIIHPLQSLTIGHHRAETTIMFGNSSSEIDLSQLILMARFLNGLFPDIQTLTASVREKEWGKVWQLLKFCQDSRDDEKSRKSIGDCVDAS